MNLIEVFIIWLTALGFTLIGLIPFGAGVEDLSHDIESGYAGLVVGGFLFLASDLLIALGIAALI